MWVGTGSMWGPELGVLPKTQQEQHKERGLGHGQEDGSNVDPLQPRVRAGAALEWWILRKALERPQSPPRVAVEGTVRTAGSGGN